MPAGLRESTSSAKDTALSATANLQAIAMAGDEILKNTFANNAFEHFEIAVYKSLLAPCPAAGMDSARAPLDASFKEEERMARWIAAKARWSGWSASDVKPLVDKCKAGASLLVSGAGDTTHCVGASASSFWHLVNFAPGRNALWRRTFALIGYNS